MPGWSELIIIALVAFLVMGPKEMARGLRRLGQVTTKLRRKWFTIHNEFEQILREADVHDLQKGVSPPPSEPNEKSSSETEFIAGEKYSTHDKK